MPSKKSLRGDLVVKKEKIVHKKTKTPTKTPKKRKKRVVNLKRKNIYLRLIPHTVVKEMMKKCIAEITSNEKRTENFEQISTSKYGTENEGVPKIYQMQKSACTLMKQLASKEIYNILGSVRLITRHKKQTTAFPSAFNIARAAANSCLDDVTHLQTDEFADEVSKHSIVSSESFFKKQQEKDRDFLEQIENLSYDKKPPKPEKKTPKPEKNAKVSDNDVQDMNDDTIQEDTILHSGDQTESDDDNQIQQPSPKKAKKKQKKVHKTAQSHKKQKVSPPDDDFFEGFD